jgi:4-diphosphocytidyl-2-C-methyl-D-erythritol kinase
MRELTQSSPAKINLVLRVGGVRPDGFHEIESLVARVGLCDTVTVSQRDDGRFTLACDDPTVPADDTNLALRAARRLAEATGAGARGVHIRLEKCIPAGAGLGGGSSNAASVLRLLNELWGLEVPAADLLRIGAEIGSDVPLFFSTPLCIVRGRGEHVEEVRRSLTGWVVLILPAIHLPTGDVYAAWDRLTTHPGRPSLASILQPARGAEALMPYLFNDLEPAAQAVRPALGELMEEVGRVSGGTVRMTGSGCGLFHLFDDRERADGFAQRVRDRLEVRTEVVPLET